MKRVYLDPIEEDLTGQAGWMYTDLMLALMVVFLATITFIPQPNDAKLTNQPKSNSNYSYSKIFQQSMNSLYESFSLAQIESDIVKFKSKNGLKESATIVFAQYVGGYSSGTETPATAIARALAFSRQLDSSNHELLSNAATALSSSNVLKSNQVIVRFTFAISSNIENQ